MKNETDLYETMCLNFPLWHSTIWEITDYITESNFENLLNWT